ncbi:type II secretion system protein GspL [Psychromonas sp.]|uniref:type II secretion system protein GspL n=1 Tax=Psychromonas sp. TaxID=1884585 RepID=UPI00356A6166
MNERLIIRLASSASQKNHWLIWSDSENEIIASGEVDNAEQLNLLTEKALQRRVICLLPGVDVALKKVAITGVFNRQMQQALPYLIEEELASDVEKLHFSVLAKETDLVYVAICDKQKMHLWLEWLEDAQIKCKQFIPEGLALPLSEDGHWQAVQLGESWLIRETENIAWSCELSMLEVILESKLKNCADQDSIPQIDSYSPVLENSVGQWINLDPVLPMELLAIGTQNNKVNILTDEFKQSKDANQYIEKWRVPAMIAVILLLVSMLSIYTQTLKVESQTAIIKEQVETLYRQAFPRESQLPYARINNKLEGMMANLKGDAGGVGFLSMLNDLSPAITVQKDFRINNLKYDGKKQELQIAVTASSFQAFEKFSATLPAHLSAEQGALNNSQSGVSGTLTVRSK